MIIQSFNIFLWKNGTIAYAMLCAAFKDLPNASKYLLGYFLVICFHSLGRFTAANQLNISRHFSIFLPFIGTCLSTQLSNVSIENKLKISVSGFLSGIGAALICYYVARDNNSPLMFSIAYAGFIFHLMALMPISYLDGHYASQNLSHNLWLIGIPLMLMAYYIIPNPWLLIIPVFGSIQLIHYYLKPDKNPTTLIPLETQLQYIALYLGMIIFLSFMSYSLYDMFQKHILP